MMVMLAQWMVAITALDASIMRLIVTHTMHVKTIPVNQQEWTQGVST